MSDALSALCAALVGALVALWTAERNHRLTNVTAERAAWRSRMRELAADLMAGRPDVEDAGSALSVRRRAAVGIQLSLNPFDGLDRELAELASHLAEAEERDLDEERLFALRMQLLLKHDWERAKQEASWTGTLLAAFRMLTGRRSRPRPPEYARFVDWTERHPVQLDRRLPPT